MRIRSDGRNTARLERDLGAELGPSSDPGAPSAHGSLVPESQFEGRREGARARVALVVFAVEARRLCKYMASTAQGEHRFFVILGLSEHQRGQLTEFIHKCFCTWQRGDEGGGRTAIRLRRNFAAFGF